MRRPTSLSADSLERWMTVSALFFPSGMQNAIAKTQPALPPGRRGVFR